METMLFPLVEPFFDSRLWSSRSLLGVCFGSMRVILEVIGIIHRFRRECHLLFSPCMPPLVDPYLGTCFG